MKHVLLAIAFIAFSADLAWAGKYNPTLDVGAAAPDWKDLPGVDDKRHSLNDYAQFETLVIIFTCNTCPTATDYEPRIKALASRFEGGKQCAVIAINANQVADDLLPKMQERAKKQSYNFDYLHDDSQSVAKAYGATVTPEFFVLDKQRKVVYMGALDDATDAKDVKVRYVEDAIAAALAGKKPEVTETVGRGCLVRYVRERRKK